MRSILHAVLVGLLMTFSSVVFAVNQFNIIPNVTEITVTSTQSALITYTVTATVPLISATVVTLSSPTYPVPSYVNVSLQNDTCTGKTSRTVGATCSFVVNIQNPNSAAGEFTLSPIVSSGSARSTAVPVRLRVVAALPTVPTPTFSLIPGTYTSAQNVTFSTSLSNAVVYYTTNGSTPTTSSSSCTGSCSLTVAQSTVIKTFAAASGYANSSIASASYTINSGAVPAAAPTFSPTPGIYASPQTVTFSSSTPNTLIYYTTDGTTPTASSSTCSSCSVTVSSTTTIKALATSQTNSNSAIVSNTYTINSSATPASAPTFTPPPGTYSGTQVVGFSSATSGATIYYTLDGSTPTSTSSTCTTSCSVSVTSTTTIKAQAVATGYANSSVSSATYTINGSASPTATPTFSLPTGTYTQSQTVTISAATGATIYYSTNGSNPTSAYSCITSCSVQIDVTTTLKAQAAIAGSANSAIASITYTINPSATAISLSVLPAGGTYAGAQNVAITPTNTSSSAVTVYYTLDGTTPSTSSSSCSSSQSQPCVLPVNQSLTIQAYAINPAYANSAVSVETYRIGFFSITPSSTTSLTSPTTLTYTVQSLAPSGVNLTNLRLDPGFALPAAFVTTTLLSDTCTGATLTPNGTCTFTITITGQSVSNLKVMPRVYATNSQTSSPVLGIPSGSNQVPLNFGSALPGINVLSLNAGPVEGGLLMTITGFNLGSATAVNFGTTPGAIMSNTSTAIIVRIPPGDAGVVQVTVVTAAGVSNTMPFTYNTTPTLESITINPSHADAFIPGSTGITPTQLHAIGTYSDSSTVDITQNVTWASVSPGIASVASAQTNNTNGQVTGVSSASTTITASLDSNSGSATVTVTQPTLGAQFNDDIIYCLGTSCAFLPSGVNPNTGAPYAGGVVARYDIIASSPTASGPNETQTDTGNDGLIWGGNGTAIGVYAQSATNGQGNTVAASAALISLQLNTYATGICSIYSTGTDTTTNWHLPATDELYLLYLTCQFHGGACVNFNTSGSWTSAGFYWSSSENTSNSADQALEVDFSLPSQLPAAIEKFYPDSIRCVRFF
ncbi:MAG: chitobiase/beta-hexosaminidase C-terminal domain-containing protein [Gammaproteobacteria bacterium]|nr:chitobiase/beta-hexosaminidase C-terminal domain-containing protein [Gammaproteobacteria bacterium]